MVSNRIASLPGLGPLSAGATRGLAVRGVLP